MKLLVDAVSKVGGRHQLLLQRTSPTILFGVGVVGVGVSTVLACRATLKVDGVLSEAKNKMELCDMVLTDPEKEYDQADHDQDVMLIKYKTAVQVVKLYAPAVIVGGLAILSLTQSHRTLVTRNNGLVAAYVALERGFAEYRARVIDKYGENVDRDMRYGTEKVKVLDEKTGKEKTVTRVGPGIPSIYARFYDPANSRSWSKDPETNLLFLHCQQQHANDLLHSRGHVFLNEVYDSLGMERSRAGAVVGWILSQDGSTDNFVNFGVFDGSVENARDFVNGREGAVLLDFNVDGLIYHLIERDMEPLSWQLSS
jgi:Family of unknown function (DUF6353)